MNEFFGAPLSVGPAPGHEHETGKEDVEMGGDDSETAGGEARLETAAQTQQGKYGHDGEART